MRSFRVSLSTLALGAVLAFASACGDEDPQTNPDAAVNDPPDSTVTGLFTLHYHRVGPSTAATYAGWTVVFGGEVTHTAPLALSEVDDFGAKIEVPLADAAVSFTYYFTDGEKRDPVEPAEVRVADSDDLSAWHWHNGSEPLLHTPPGIPTPEQLLFYYLRTDGSYGQYGIYSWGSSSPLLSWPGRELRDGVDDELGAWYLIDLTGLSTDACPFGDFCFIVQAGSDATKDPAADRGVDTALQGNQFFLLTGDPQVYTCPERVARCVLGAGEVEISGASAHLIAADTLAWKLKTTEAATHELRYSADATIALDGKLIVGGEIIAISPTSSITPAQAERFPYLSTYTAFRIAGADRARIVGALSGQLIAIAYNAVGEVVEATKVQPAGILDELYRYEGPLGLDFTRSPAVVRVWAPTAQSVALKIYDANLAPTATATMTRSADGVWSAVLEDAWYGAYYRYELKVYHPSSGGIETYESTDPYSTSLSRNSTHTQIVDVHSDPALKPAGWDMLVKPPLPQPEDVVIYETHIRDFSVGDEGVLPEDRGKFTAFSYNGVGGAALSNAMNHLTQLASSGLTVLHLLPAFDVATIEEDETARVELLDPFQELCDKNPLVPAEKCTAYGTMRIVDVLRSSPGDSLEQQEVATWIRDLDGFNWGYDPFHYSAPEGSYSTNAQGPQRVLEFREMVRSLSDIGLRVALDVVYNHTNASGVSARSVLDKVVPWYYHRLNPETGLVMKETCCEDTATENRMMERLMIDSVVLWAKVYRIDAFRFDLMGYHLKRNMEALRAALDALTPANDGVDGREIYLYGEGWNPGTQGETRGVNATQLNLPGSGIGTFNDRIRDGVRGGGPFASGLEHVVEQGFITGRAYDPNDPTLFGPSGRARDPVLDLATVLYQNDLISVGLTGNLANFRFVASAGVVVRGGLIPYNGAPAGYTLDPQEAINYIEKHDNETLFDITLYKHPLGTEMADRVRAHNVGTSLIALGQGVPFFQLGQDLLRSKSMDRNSYNASDWFNWIDWRTTAPNFKVGMPMSGDNMPSYEMIRVVFGDPTINFILDHVRSASAQLRETLTIRTSTPLFRLGTEAEIRKRLDFYNVGTEQIPGVIAMGITDGTNCATAVDDLDPTLDAVFVVFNANDETQTIPLDEAANFELHPVQRASADPVLQDVTIGAGSFSVPARTTAVFVDLQGKGQGAGLPCNGR
jgi:pullulanase-type alpha-1,6-glucosidase